MKKQSLKVGVAFVLVACASFAMAQSRFIWTDENGRKVYSDNPPPVSVPRAKILKGIDQIGKAPPTPIAPSPSVASSGTKSGTDAKEKGPLTLAERDAESKKANKSATEKAKESAEKSEVERVRQERCGQLRTYLASLESGNRISRTNASGEREVVDDETRKKEAEQTKASISKECA